MLNDIVSIKPIDKTTVNQICSGQVVLNLATAVKELIENSIDAGASVIQIRLKEYGSQSIEVSDNGCGVEEQNFQALTLKHHTSKIADFGDLVGVETFGFRGEALSSLCSLSDVTITTRHKTVDYGSKLEMDHCGIITQISKTARQVGTTVTLENIFNTLPVRHKEFLRNLKKEFTKMCSVMYAYGLQSCGVSISCTNQSGQNKRTTVMETSGESVKSNIGAIFGQKQTQHLVAVTRTEPPPAVLEEYGLSGKAVDCSAFHLEGFVSSCAHGAGRSASDRQFFFVNSRPVDNTKMVKLVNEVYHQFNAHQYPFVVLNVTAASDAVDVNLTPDKRQILLENEKLLLVTLKASLLHVFQHVPASLTVQTPPVALRAPRDKAVDGGLGLMERLGRFRTASSSPRADVSRTKQQKLSDYAVVRREEVTKDRKEAVEMNDSPLRCEVEKPASTEVEERSTTWKVEEVVLEPEEVVERAEPKRKCDAAEGERREKRARVDDGPSRAWKEGRDSVPCTVTFEKIRKLWAAPSGKAPDGQMRFLSRIHPASNEQAEGELRRELRKETFAEMEVVGQFNLGFIITKLGGDLFIIDQHATDEKFNFETLQRGTALQNQRLIAPQHLHLTVDKEELMVHHAEVFKKNGFDFAFDETAPPTKRVQLLSIPHSKAWVFGKEDVDELLFMLEDAPPGKLCRPSRVRDMFASRACRKSVMIGTALSRHEMRRLVDHMGEMEQPWNCPHGRPTIRHLVNTAFLDTHNIA